MVQFITRAVPGIPPRRMHLVQWDQEGYHYQVVCDTDNIQWTSQWWQTTIEIWKTNWKIAIKIETYPDKDDNLKYLRAIAHMNWWSSSTAIEDLVHKCWNRCSPELPRIQKVQERHKNSRPTGQLVNLTQPNLTDMFLFLVQSLTNFGWKKTFPDFLAWKTLKIIWFCKKNYFSQNYPV